MDGSSDHTPVIATVSTRIIDRPNNSYLCNKRTDWIAFSIYLDDKIDLKVKLKSEEDISTAATYITTLIQKAAWLSTPASACYTNETCRNLPLNVKKRVLEKRRLRRVWHNTRQTKDKTAFNKAAAELKKYLQDIEDYTINQKLEQLSPNHNNEYSLWKTIKSAQKPSLHHHPLKLADDSWARTDLEKAEAFGNFLKLVFTPNETDTDKRLETEIKSYLDSDLQLSPPLKCCTPAELRRTINALKPKKAPGFDLITPEVLQKLPRKAVMYLTHLFNGILRTSFYPKIWKVSQLTMIPKPGKPPHIISSYRPISLLPILSKVFEKLLKTRLDKILSENNIFPDHQFGFRSKHSTIEQVHRVTDKIRNALENKEYCAGAFLDIQQAFDKVWHQGLLYKLKKQLPHNMFTLLQSYLEDRLFFVKVNDATSPLQCKRRSSTRIRARANLIPHLHF